MYESCMFIEKRCYVGECKDADGRCFDLIQTPAFHEPGLFAAICVGYLSQGKCLPIREFKEIAHLRTGALS